MDKTTLVDLNPDSKDFIVFIERQKGKDIAYLVNILSVPLEEAEDIYQEACIDLYNNLKEGKVYKQAALSSYFLQICKFKATHYLRKVNRYNGVTDVEVLPENNDKDFAQYKDEKILELLNILEEGQEKEFLSTLLDKVEGIVSNLPEPCDKLLWMRYWDGLSHSEIAAIMKYKSQSVSKTLTSRCLGKFKNAVLNLVSKLVYERR